MIFLVNNFAPGEHTIRALQGGDDPFLHPNALYDHSLADKRVQRDDL